MRRGIEINLSSLGTGSVLLDGEKVHGVKGFTLSCDVDEVPTVTLDLLVLDCVHAEVETAELEIPEGTRDTLVRLGWTPPKEES